MINGLIYLENFISLADQTNLINQIDNCVWDFSLKRRTQHYGFRYDYSKKKVDQSLYLGPIPNYLIKYCELLSQWFDRLPDQVIINEYLPGQGISRHVDCVPCFGDTIASLSLLSPCIMEFEKLGSYEKRFQLLNPLSLVVLKNEARYKWMHSIPSRIEDKWQDINIVRGRRISLTFRNVILND